MYNKEYFQKQYGTEIRLPIDFRMIVEFLNPKPGEKVLDAGCGLGRIAYEISKYGSEVVGIDISHFAMAVARKTYSENAMLKFTHMDALEMTFIEHFDKVLCYHLLEHLTRIDAQRLLAKIYYALKSQGIVVIGAPIQEGNLIRKAIRLIARGSTLRDPTHLWSVSLAEICDLIRNVGFTINDMCTFSYFTWIRSLDKLIPFLGRKIITNAVIQAQKPL